MGYERDDSGFTASRVARLMILFAASKLLPFKSGRRAKISSSSALAAAARSCVGRPRAFIGAYSARQEKASPLAIKARLEFVYEDPPSSGRDGYTQPSVVVAVGLIVQI